MMEAILSDAIVALETFDLTSLERLECQLSQVAECELKLEGESTRRILEKIGLLGIFLHNCGANLNTLKQLHSRNAGISWVR
ncbi:MAG: hypothetical protein M3Y50_09760 [Acidobacteriota bacterium]|nr:hypothetical protein [Acidobacteriota bacterium]